MTPDMLMDWFCVGFAVTLGVGNAVFVMALIGHAGVLVADAVWWTIGGVICGMRRLVALWRA